LWVCHSSTNLRRLSSAEASSLADPLAADSLVDETFPAADPRTLYLTRTRTHSLSDLLAASLRPRDLIASYYVVDFPVIATNTRFIQY